MAGHSSIRDGAAGRPFAEMLATGGKSNSLGEAAAVVGTVLAGHSRLDELYRCLSHGDAWVRMRAADSLEKVCRIRPEWLLPYADRLLTEAAKSTQPSIQWHLAQMYTEIPLDKTQKAAAITWLKNLLSTADADWIVAGEAMNAMMHFTAEGTVPADETAALLQIQTRHASNAVVKRARKLLASLQP